jgi:hypothetical protein
VHDEAEIRLIETHAERAGRGQRLFCVGWVEIFSR